VLYHNEGEGFFEDKTFEAGLGDAMPFVKWGIAFFDFDNDGNPDILIVSGPIYARCAVSSICPSMRSLTVPKTNLRLWVLSQSRSMAASSGSMLILRI